MKVRFGSIIYDQFFCSFYGAITLRMKICYILLWFSKVLLKKCFLFLIGFNVDLKWKVREPTQPWIQ